MGDGDVRYYAVAVGRQQRITTKYREYRYLVRGYPDAQYFITDDYELAEKYIKDYNASLKKKDSIFYEENLTYVPSFINHGYSNTSVDNVLWISSMSRDNGMTRNFDMDFQVYTETLNGISNAVSYTLKTNIDLDLPSDEDAKIESENKDVNFYKDSKVKHKSLVKESNLMLITSLTDTLIKLKNAGEKTLYVVTDSHYLSNLLVEDINHRLNLDTIPLKYYNEIYDLYEMMNKFERIFVSRYSAPSNGMLHEKILTLNFNRCVDLTEVKK